MADAAVEKPTEAHEAETCEKEVTNGKEANGVTPCTAAESSPTKLKEKLVSPAKHRLEEEEDKPDKDADFPCNGKADGHETKRMKKGAAEADKKETPEGDDDEDDEEHDEDDDDDDDDDDGEEGEEEEGEEADE